MAKEISNNMTIMLRPTELIVFLQGIKKCVTFPRAHKEFDYIYNYVVQEDATEEGFLDRFLTVATEAIEKYSNGAITADSNGMAVIDGLQLPHDVLSKIKELRNKGYDWESHQKFWARCLLNPRRESVTDLFRFISNHNLTITTDGKFIAYKAVTKNFKDKHTNSIDNYPGCVVTMPRDQVAFDPNQACSSGLHVANLRYAHGFADGEDVIVLVEVNPSDVVSVPYDSNAEKIRCCKYKVLRIWEGEGLEELPTSVVEVNDDGDLDVVKTDAEKRAEANDRTVDNSVWTSVEDSLLVAAVNCKGEAWDVISTVLSGRSAEDCESRYAEIMTSKQDGENKTPSPAKGSLWSAQEDKILKDMYNNGKSYSDISAVIGRSPKAVAHRVKRLQDNYGSLK